MKKLFLLFIIFFLFWGCPTDITNDINAHGTVIIKNDDSARQLTKIGFQLEGTTSYNLDNDNKIKDAYMAYNDIRSFEIAPGKYTVIVQNDYVPPVTGYTKITINKDETIYLFKANFSPQY